MYSAVLVVAGWRLGKAQWQKLCIKLFLSMEQCVVKWMRRSEQSVLSVTQETSPKPSWADGLLQSFEADASRVPSSLANVPAPGRLMAALDLLRHGLVLSAPAQLQCAHHLLPFVMHVTCEHLNAKALETPGLRSAVAQAVVIFLAACCSNRCALLVMCSLSMQAVTCAHSMRTRKATC